MCISFVCAHLHPNLPAFAHLQWYREEQSPRVGFAEGPMIRESRSIKNIHMYMHLQYWSLGGEILRKLLANLTENQLWT